MRRRISGAGPGRRLLKLHVRRLGSVEVAIQPSHRIARPVRVALDPSGRRMKGADQGFSEHGLEILQRRVREDVQQLGHKGAPELEQGFFGRVRATVAERCGQVVEGGIGL